MCIVGTPPELHFGMNATDRPVQGEMAPYYFKYVDATPGVALPGAMKNAAAKVITGLRAIPEAKAGHRYAEGKWSVKEVIQHMIDAERIFAYRALRFARNDGKPLQGFDEDSYAPESRADRRDLPGLVEEYAMVSAATLALFGSFDTEMLLRSGTANDQPMSVRAAGWVIAGHALHHLHVIEERYLNT